jgi:hypothetical protein
MAREFSVRRVLLFVFAACSGVSRAGEHELSSLTKELPDVPAPPHGDVWWISKSMRMNGLPMTLKNFRSRLSSDEVCEYYRSSARAMTNNEILRSRSGDWSVISIRTRRNLITIQVRSTLLGSEGTIAVSPPPETAQLKIATAFPRPATAEIVNLQEYDDEGTEAEHITLRSARSVGLEAQAFVQKLTRNGWQITLREPMQVVAGGQVIEAQRGAQHALLSLMPDKARPGNTSIIVVWRKS